MDCAKTGALIRRLRLEQGLTQAALAARVGVGAKAVSKWELGQGCPDVSLLAALAQALGVPAEGLLAGALDENSPVPGNMKKLSFLVCPACGSITVTTGAVQASCCGRSLSPLVPRKAGPEDALTVETVEDQWLVTGSHPMTKDDHISFLALARGDSVQILKQYPEWDLLARLPKQHGTLYFYSTTKGLFYQHL